MIYLDLLIGFLEVGLFSFGGAYAAIPLIRDVVMAHGWLDEEMLTDMIAVSESTPGPLMVNMATYVGSVKGGIPGAAIATAAVVLPAFVILLLIVTILKKGMRNRYVQAALSGLNPCVIGIILATGCMMILNNCGLWFGTQPELKNICLTIGIGMIYFGSRKLMKKGLTPIMLICLSAVAGLLAYAG